MANVTVSDGIVRLNGAARYGLYESIGAQPKTEWLDGVVERDDRLDQRHHPVDLRGLRGRRLVLRDALGFSADPARPAA